MTRYCWAVKALDKIEKHLKDSDLLPKHRKDVSKLSIALLGSTQVGKTTLALRLLGANKKELDSLYDLLRGYREEGQSATAVATIYYPTLDKNSKYSIEILGENNKSRSEYSGNDDVAFKDKMGYIRNEYLRFSSNKKESSSEVKIKDLLLKIGLPISEKSEIMSEVIDLVGLGAKSEWERIASHNIADKWLKRCDIPIFVARASNIDDLNKNSYQDLIYGWKNFPLKRKFLITTWSFEANSVVSALNKEQLDNSTDKYEYAHNHIQNEIMKKTVLNSLQEEISLYTISVGCSDEGFREASEIGVKKLNEDIQAMESEGPELFRIKQAFLYKESISKVIELKTSHYKDKIDEQENQIDSAQRKQCECESYIESLENKLIAIKSDYDKIVEGINKKIEIAKPDINSVCNGYKWFEGKRYRDCIHSYMVLSKSRLIQECKKIYRDIGSQGQDFRSNYNLDLSISPIRLEPPCLRNIDKIFNEKIYPYNWRYIKKERKDQVKQNLDDWIDEAQDCCYEYVHTKFDEDNQELIKDEKNRIKRMLKRKKRDRQKLENRLTQKKDKLKDIKEDNGRFLHNVQEARVVISKYNQFLREGYIKKRNMLQEKVKQGITDNDVVAVCKNIASIYELSKEAEYIAEKEV